MNNSKTKKMTAFHICMCAIFTALTAIGAFIKIPIPYTVFTLQYPITMLAGQILGGKYGAISVGAYVFLGLIGVPIFAEGGGIYYVLKPTFGYLVGFILGTFVTGKIANAKSEPSIKRLLAADFLGMIIVYALGLTYFYFAMNFWVEGDGIALGSLLYSLIFDAPGDIVFCIAGAFIGKRLIPAIAKATRN
ncbi:MAG: biotin transporter BioY [Porcipelethomonas sp.]